LVSDLSPLDDGTNRISIKSQGGEIRRVLELLSTQASVNILSSPGVVGVIDINLEDVSFEDALNVILKLANLKAREENGVVYVYTAAEFAAIEAQERTPIVRVYHLNYARAEDVATMISPLKITQTLWSSLAMGWRPPVRSMMLKRRNPSPTPGS
jgi:type II secretory pathway component HofQ